MTHGVLRAAALFLAAATLLAPRSGAAASYSVAHVEVVYADWLDAVGAVSTIDSGLTPRIAGEGRGIWAARLKALTPQLALALKSSGSAALSPEDARAVQAMRKGFVDYSPQVPDAGAHGSRATCADGTRAASDAASLQIALYACFEEIGDRIDFEGRPMFRTTALQQLQQLPDSERRRRLFFALSPLWIAVNGANSIDSPYRRMMVLNGADVRRRGRSPISDAATTLGITSPEVEQWLVQVLEAWRARSEGPPLEPWDYWYASAGASRDLSCAIPHDSILALSKRFYRDLGADLDTLEVQHDLEVRPGKSPLAYTDQIRIGRRIGKIWRPTLARVSGNYELGGMFVLNELIHEDGHAVHYSAVRARPAFFSLGDDVFFEAFADVPAWSSSEPAWQQKYLGRHTDEGSALRDLFSGVMLDAAWGLFELRMLADPSMDPNLLWTDITSRYLNIVPHPEWSWWALRVQLVRWPGYMINYGLGAVLTADIREHIRDSIGQFDAGNPRWYQWTSARLLRFGSSIDTAQLLQQFLGRAVSPDAILRQLQRVGSVDMLARQHLGQTQLE
ncbi:MAG: hypothetical protein ABJC66_11285 [Gammaproteobacteria bacterium]